MKKVLFLISMVYSLSLFGSGFEPYTTYSAYTGYKPSLAVCVENPHYSSCAGTQEQCENYPHYSACSGTLAQCEEYPHYSACTGTLAQCEKYPHYSACSGTLAQCEEYPHYSACSGTKAQCEAYPHYSACKDAPPPNPCDDDYYGDECKQKRCQNTYSYECAEIYCRYHPEDANCYDEPTPPVFDPELDQKCRAAGYYK